MMSHGAYNGIEEKREKVEVEEQAIAYLYYIKKN